MMYTGEFFESFGVLNDIRQEGKVLHKLIDILFIVVSASICGMNEWKDIHMWANIDPNIVWLKKYIELPNGIPSLSTIGRIFNIISTKQFEKSFVEWMKTVVDRPENDIIPIDGKTSRGSHEKIKGKKGAHIVSALCNSYHLVLGQVKTDDKSNEITAIPELLDMLFIEGCIVTIDAMGLQKKITEKIVKDNHADYVISLKGNQETLQTEVKEYFDDLKEENKLENPEIKKHMDMVEVPLNKGVLGILKTVEKGHGRIEKRTYYYSTDTDWMMDAKKSWEKLTGIGMVIREVDFIGYKDKNTKESVLYIGSIDNVKDFSRAVRNHWTIESMHWNLDVSFRDDENRTRKGNIVQNMALLKKIVLNTVRNDTKMYPQYSMRSKRVMAMMNLEYRDYLLNLNFKTR